MFLIIKGFLFCARNLIKISSKPFPKPLKEDLMGIKKNQPCFYIIKIMRAPRKWLAEML
jgi:hypothetical protein